MTELGAEWQKLRSSPHVREQAERILPLIRMSYGTVHAPQLEHVVDSLATCIQALWHNADSQVATDGPIRVIRQPFASDVANQNYDVTVHGASVFGMHLWMEQQSELARGTEARDS